MNNVPPVCFAGKFCEGRVPAGDYRHRHKPNEIAEERNEADALVGDLSNARKIGGIGVRNTNATSREAAPTNTSWYCLWYSHPGDSPGHANDHNKKDTKQVVASRFLPPPTHSWVPMDRIWQPPARLWKGELPPHIYRNPVFSCKIFLGGIPSDVTELNVVDTTNVNECCRLYLLIIPKLRTVLRFFMDEEEKKFSLPPYPSDIGT
ncbi:unnamed protein product [Toxocara canis]|uniref:RRM domain-containing protein n=1 Tax=Toxocara canis TaxID=6265 RepID=A0A183V6V9_TOXCA|nr:unnamed protein product [Toxocara canis]